MTDADDHDADRWRLALRSFLELFALAGLAITQPLLDVFGDAPDFFVFRDAGRNEVIAFAVLVAVVPAALLWGVEQVIGLAGARARRVTHLGFVGLLVALLVMGAIKQADLTTGALLVVAGAAAGVLAALAFRRWAAVRSWVRVLALAPLLFVGLFLTSSPAAALLDSQNIAAATIAPVDDPHTVVMLQFDEWPLQSVVDGEGQIDPDLYPNLSALAGDGAWYRNASTAATFTTYAVPAILTGRFADGNKTAIASDYPENLFTLLGGQFDLEVIETVTRLCPENLCDGPLVDHPRAGTGRETGTTATSTTPSTAVEEPSSLDIVGQLLSDARQTFQAQVSPDPDAAGPAEMLGGTLGSVSTTTTATPSTTGGLTPQEAADQAAAATTTTAAGGGGPLAGFGMPGGLPTLSLDSVDQLVRSIEAGEDPTLHFLHVLLPHTPYKFLPDGRTYVDEAEGPGGGPGEIIGTRSDEPAEVQLAEQRLLLQASYTDSVIGRVVDRLKAQGLYEDAIIVVAADHGIGLSPGGVIRAVPGADELPRQNYSDLLYVPLVIKAPGLGEPATVSDDNVQTVDILPTIADELGIELPWAVDGIALGGAPRRTPRKETHVVGIGGGSGGPGLSVGPALEFNGREVLREVLDRNVDTLLRDDNPTHRVYNINDAGEIVGDRVRDHDLVTATDTRAQIKGLEAYETVDTNDGVLPTHLTGSIDAPDADDLVVAVALNGRIAAVTSTWEQDGEAHHLEAMLVPELLRDGANELTVYLAGGREGHRTLAPMTVTPAA